jgi:hypothetical protein
MPSAMAIKIGKVALVENRADINAPGSFYLLLLSDQATFGILVAKAHAGHK